jgi:GNAT superfamily N-acetyltransferase
VIRRAGRGDAEAIARIFRESRAEAMPWLPVLHDPGDELQHFRGRVETDEVFVLEREGAIVGFAILNGDELDGFYVAPQHQRAGVGAALFRHVQEQRPERFGFWVFRDNERARRFYESHGARPLYETDGSDNEERTPDARYEWRPPRTRTPRGGPGTAPSL